MRVLAGPLCVIAAMKQAGVNRSAQIAGALSRGFGCAIRRDGAGLSW